LLADAVTEADADVPVTMACTGGDPAEEIVRYAGRHPIDLIVVGSHGRTGFSRLLLGSVAERVVRTAPCPVLTVPAPKPVDARELAVAVDAPAVSACLVCTTPCHPRHHPGYYPGARPIHLKLLLSVPDGRIVGAQAVGKEAVEKRIDVIAMAIHLGGTVHDLAEAELCYAPQYGAAKDPVNLAGMIAQNVLAGDMPLADWASLDRTDALVVDAREPDEFAAGHVPGAINLPLSRMRERWSELPPDREIWVIRAVGQRAYYATRFLAQDGFRVRNLSGGFTTNRELRASGLVS
jgi:rhodanese-related sulfurtransferase